MNITPLGKRVVVQPQTQEEVTSFGLVLSDAGKEKPMQGTVVAISDDTKTVKKGDTVLFKKYSPTEFTDSEGNELYVLDEEDLLAKLS